MKSQVTALYKYGLIDLIAGKTPTMTSWTVDPTDAANITDGDITTFCTTGNKVAPGAWQGAIFQWDLGNFYTVLLEGVGYANATAGTTYIYPYFYDGSNWIRGDEIDSSAIFPICHCTGAMCSGVRIALMSSQAATITPDIREFHVWRLK